MTRRKCWQPGAIPAAHSARPVPVAPACLTVLDRSRPIRDRLNHDREARGLGQRRGPAQAGHNQGLVHPSRRLAALGVGPVHLFGELDQAGLGLASTSVGPPSCTAGAGQHGGGLSVGVAQLLGVDVAPAAAGQRGPDRGRPRSATHFVAVPAADQLQLDIHGEAVEHLPCRPTPARARTPLVGVRSPLTEILQWLAEHLNRPDEQPGGAKPCRHTRWRPRADRPRRPRCRDEPKYAKRPSGSARVWALRLARMDEGRPRSWAQTLLPGAVWRRRYHLWRPFRVIELVGARQ